MNEEESRRQRRVKLSWRPHIVCHSCGGAPTCPMLHQDLWKQVWSAFCHANARGEMPRIYEHRATALTNQMLCMECAERALGRQLTLDDLLPCMGNYPHYVMQVREMRALVSSDDPYEGSFREAADNEGARIAAEDRDDGNRDVAEELARAHEHGDR